MTRVERRCWCGATEARETASIALDDGDVFCLVRCRGCGVYALDPQPDDAQLMKYYASEYYGKTRRKFIGPVAGFVELFQEGRARMLAREVNTGGAILDVGCGNGGFLLQMHRRGYDVSGTEWSQQSAARVPSDSRVRVYIGDLLDIDFHGKTFDAITLWHVFEHLRKPYESLLRIRSLLKDDGRLYMSMPNHESWQARRFGPLWFHLDPPRHLFGFSPDSLEKALDLAGFSIQHLDTWSMEQNPYGYLQSVLNTWFSERNRAYSTLKGTRRGALAARLADVALVGALTPPALLYSTAESLAGHGATMTVAARPRGN